MGKLLLAIAVLGTLLPLLEGTLLKDTSGENGVSQRLESGEKLCKGQGSSTVGTKGEADKQPCGIYNTMCGAGASSHCCVQGQDCDTGNGVCKCLQTPDKHCDLLCRQNVTHACCVTAVYSNGLCQCCLGNQVCDPGKGCDCGTNHCDEMCAKDPGSGAIGCCVETKCTCCKKGLTCTVTGCKLPCDPSTCQNICKGTCDTATATCKSNCATNEICKDGQCQPKCDDACISANCKSCVNEVCVTSCPSSECIGGTCSTTPCDQAACIKSCDGTCNLSTNRCNSGCPGNCVSGKCPCDDAKCKSSCGVCVSGSCQLRQCPAGTSCNPTSGLCECQGAGEGLCCKDGGTCVCCNQKQSCDSLGPSCMCDPTKCTATSCLKCGSDRVTCEALTCGPCETCTFGNGCQSTCNATQKCDGTKCVDKCLGVTCSNGDICVGGSCVCDSSVCGVVAGQKCRICGSSGTCEPKTCSLGLNCDAGTGDCLCTDLTCAAKCSGQGDPCCTFDMTDCVCCVNSFYCGPGDSRESSARENSPTGNSSSMERISVGVCTNPCTGLICPIPGDSCKNGDCTCDGSLCGLNNLCEACGSTGHCGPIECGPCETCDPQKGCQFQCDRATQACVNGVCKCSEIGCAGGCVNGRCVCRNDQCKPHCLSQGQADGCCSGGICYCCDLGTCNPHAIACDLPPPCDIGACKDACTADKKVSCCVVEGYAKCGCCDQGEYCQDGYTCTKVEQPCPSDANCDAACKSQSFKEGCCMTNYNKGDPNNFNLVQWLLDLVFKVLCEQLPQSFSFLCDEDPGQHCICCKDGYSCQKEGGCVKTEKFSFWWSSVGQPGQYT